MDPITLAIGGAAAVYGGATLVLRFVSPHRLKDYGPMRQRFGQTAGMVIHTVGYSLLPLGFGLFCIFLAATGGSIMHMKP